MTKEISPYSMGEWTEHREELGPINIKLFHYFDNHFSLYKRDSPIRSALEKWSFYQADHDALVLMAQVTDE